MRLTTSFVDANGVPVDPTTVAAKVRAPAGRVATFNYPANANLGKTATGAYYLDVTPYDGGRWHIRWEAQFADASLVATEDDFIVQVSPFGALPPGNEFLLESGDYIIAG